MTDDRLRAYVPQLLLHRETDGPGHWETQGTLVFADVSGFTRLTEKLSRHGKTGVEEIVRSISDVFTVLLTATAGGGDVLKFSGDALLLFYDSPDHAHRACHDALTMQRVLGAIGGIDTSRGRVRLRMSVGVHTGRFAFFLCGGDHLELYVLGGAASTTVAMESAARAGEVLVSRATAAAVHGARYGGSRGDAVVLRSLPPLASTTPSLPPTEPPDASVVPAWRFVASPLRARLAGDDLEHEHRRATVSFVQFGGVDDLIARAGARATFERVQYLTTAAMRATDHYGVLLTATDLACGGGVLMLTAGAPDAASDDEARMLRVTRTLLDTDCGLPVRAGVNAGDLFVGTVGAPYRRTYSTMGAATNLAARVMGVAPWDSVVATAAVLDEVRGRFATTPVPAFVVKGHAQPVDAGIVGAAISAGTAFSDRTVPFVGRVDELDRLHTALDDACAGHGNVVEVVGEQGIGKSRLVAELRSQATDDHMVWITAACDPYERTTPYHTASGILRQMLGISGSATPGAAGAALAELVESAAPDLLAWLPLIALVARADAPEAAQTVEVAPRYRMIRSHQAVGDLLAAAPWILAWWSSRTRSTWTTRPPS